MTDMRGAPADTPRVIEERLARYPPERYPVQHATARFHLGVALADEARFAEAEPHLRVAEELFAPGGLEVERAKARNLLGAVLRGQGRAGEAEGYFAEAARAFEEQGAEPELPAALFNLGLVRRDRGAPEEAVEPLERARSLFARMGAAASGSAAARELGTALLLAGRPSEALAALEEASGAARRAGDTAAVGVATNLLGLAHLAVDDLTPAVDAFRQAAASHPRGIRPEGYSMAKANLALAYERAGALPRARLAARQALAVTPDAPEAVRRQATEILSRAGDPPGDLARVLDEEPPEGWAGVVREELGRWAVLADAQRRSEAGAWIEGQLARDDRGTELAEAWLGGLLEQPPETMQALIRSTLEALAALPTDTQARFRRAVTGAMLHFHVPQWERLRAAFASIAAEVGADGAWS